MHSILILDDNEEQARYIEKTLRDSIANIDVFICRNYEEIRQHERLMHINVFIVNMENRTQHQTVDRANRLVDEGLAPKWSTALLISKTFYELQEFENMKMVHDFIIEPFLDNILVNRVNVLLQTSHGFKIREDSKINCELMMWDLFNYSNRFIVLVDDRGVIRLVSSWFCKTVGYNEDELLGKYFSDFAYLPDGATFDYFLNVILKTKNNKYTECSYKIVKKDGSTIDIKWFNSCIKNSKNWMFSVGMPYEENEKESDEDMLRALWKKIMDEDRMKIDAFSNLVHNPNLCLSAK